MDLERGDGTPVNLTGVTLRFLVRVYGGAANLIDKTMDEVSGVLSLTLSVNQVNTLVPNQVYLYKVLDQNDSQLAEGRVYVAAEW